MAEQTTNFNLTKDSEDDFYNIETVNENLDTIDIVLGNTARFETAGGTATSITLTGIILENGDSKTFIVAVNNNGATTKINGKPLYKPNTTATPSLIAGKAVTIWYDLAGDCFFIKASAEGNAIAAHVLAGDRFSNDNDTGIAGTLAPKIPNLIKNGSFENGDNCWEAGSVIVTGHAKTGTYSLKLTGTTATPEVIKASDPISYIQGHKYYVSLWVTSDINCRGAALFPATPPYPNISFDVVANTWNHFGMISQDSSIVSGNYFIRLDNDNNYISNTMYYDDIMVIDLTDSFGAGKEPSVDIMNTVVVNNAGWWDSKLTTLTSDATAIASQMLASVNAYVKGVKVTGTMPNFSNQTKQIVNHGHAMSVYADPLDSRMGIVEMPNGLMGAGYIDTNTRFKAQLWGLLQENIKAGAYIGQYNGYGTGYMVGTFTADANLNAAWLITGASGYANGVKINGGMANHGGYTAAIGVYNDGAGTAYVWIPYGAYLADSGSGSGTPGINIPQPDLLAGNIVAGKNIMGTVGTAKRRVSGNAIAANLSTGTYGLRTIGSLATLTNTSCVTFSISGLSFVPSYIIWSSTTYKWMGYLASNMGSPNAALDGRNTTEIMNGISTTYTTLITMSANMNIPICPTGNTPGDISWVAFE